MTLVSIFVEGHQGVKKYVFHFLVTCGMAPPYFIVLLMDAAAVTTSGVVEQGVHRVHVLPQFSWEK